MHTGTHMCRRVSLIMGVLGLSVLLPLAITRSAEPQQPQADRREAISLADSVLRALQHNLDITISRQNKEMRLTDIIFEQAKFDPLLSVNGQYNRSVSPLNRPVFGFSGAALDEIQKFDQNQ